MEQFELIAKTFQGLEEVLAQELTELGADNVQIGRRMVSFTGDKEMMYRANFCLRTAVRVLKPIRHFTAADADDVYAAVRAIEWDEILDLDTTFSVDSVVYSETFRHSKFVAYKVKDAIVDYFREKTGKRPNIRITNPDIRLNMHIAENNCTLSLDASGESLHLRGYRVSSGEAPINEVLAAGLIKLTGWKYDTDLIDPFCGSGTIIVEAALMARNIYPGIFRKSFGFEKWKDFDRDLLDRIYNDDSAEREFTHKIYGYDLNMPAVEMARANAKSAGVADCVEVCQQDFKKFAHPENPSVIVTNPPYGQRLVTPDLLGLYRAIGERLKHEYAGGEAWIIGYRQECFDEIGLKPSLKIPLYNGSLDCEFRKYQIFDGRLDEFRASGGVVKTDEERSRMSENRRSRLERGSFGDKFSGSRHEADDYADDSEEYAQLRSKHKEFERFYSRRFRDDADHRNGRGERGDRGGRRDYGGWRNDGPRNDRRTDYSRAGHESHRSRDDSDSRERPDFRRNFNGDRRQGSFRDGEHRRDGFREGGRRPFDRNSGND